MKLHVLSKGSWETRWTAAAILLAIMLVLAQISPVSNPVTWDESQLVYDAQRLLAGQVPYKDFFAFIQPACLDLMSGGPWGWWGHPETGVRFLVSISILLAWLASWLALRRAKVMAEFPAGLLAAVFPMVLYPFAGSAPHHWLAASFYLAAIAQTSFAWAAPERLGRWFWAGLWAGMTGCVLQTEAAFAAIVVGLGLLATSRDMSALVRRGAAALAGLVVTLAAFLLPVFIRGGGGDWFYRTFVWTLTTYRQPGNTNDQPFLVDLPGRLEDLWAFKRTASPWLGLPRAMAGTYLYVAFLALALALAIASFLVLARMLRRRTIPDVATLTAAVVTLFSLGVFNLSGPGWLHLTYIMPSMLLLWGLALARRNVAPSRIRFMKWALASLLAAGLICHGALIVGHRPAAWEFLDVDRIDRESPLNQSLRASPLLKPGDTIAVLPFGGNIYLYSYPAAFGFTYFFPLRYGYHDLDDQIRAVDELRKSRPKLILVHKAGYEDFLVPGSPVAELLTGDYTPVSETPALVVLERRDLVGSRGARGSAAPKGG